MLSVSVAILAIGAPAASAHAGGGVAARQVDDVAGIGIHLLDIPLARAEDPRARAYIVDHVKPGTTIKRRVEVRNSSSERQHIELYAGGASIEQNAFTAPDGRTANELSGWVRLEKASVDLSAGAAGPVGISIAVPASAAEGERYGVIWAQVTSAPTDGGNVAQIHRVGIRMYLDIGPGGEPPTDFRISGLTARQGAGKWPVVTAQVSNTGGRAIDMAGELALSLNTVRAGPFKVSNGVTILPGQRGEVQVEIAQELPAGQWDATLTLVSGVVERKAEGRITLPVGKPVPMANGTPGWLLLSVGTGIVLLVLVVVLVLSAKRRRAGLAPGVRSP